MRNNNDEVTRNYSAIEIYNSVGRKVKVLGVNTGSRVVNIQLSDLPKGMYSAAIADMEGVKRTLGRFTKQ